MVPKILTGAHGTATEVPTQPDEVAVWLIETVNSVMVLGDTDPATGTRPMMMRSQFLMVTCGLDWVPGGQYPRRADDTHDVRVLPLDGAVTAGLMGTAGLPGSGSPWVMRTAFPGGDVVAVRVSELVASALVTGELPLQGRHLALAFHRGVRLTALAVASCRESVGGVG